MPPPDASAGRRVPLRVGLTVTATAALLATLPAPSLARARQASQRDPTTPVERALTGGLVTLRSPGSLMIRVVASRFVMGSTLDEVLEARARCASEPLGTRCGGSTFMNELPQMTQRLASFWLDRTEVTVEAYERCVALGACAPRVLVGGQLRFREKALPVTLVTFDEAEAFCRFRKARLPSEAEFERAARGTKGRRYPWGELYNSRLANHGRLGRDPYDASDGFEELAPVGSFVSGRTPDGFLDLSGNAAEWTRDTYSSRHGLPPEPGGTGVKVIKGGDFQSGAAWLRGAARLPREGGERFVSLGFRCARAAGRDGTP